MPWQGRAPDRVPPSPCHGKPKGALCARLLVKTLDACGELSPAIPIGSGEAFLIEMARTEPDHDRRESAR